MSAPFPSLCISGTQRAYRRVSTPRRHSLPPQALHAPPADFQGLLSGRPPCLTSCEPLGEPVIVATDTRWRGNGGMALLTSLLGRLKDEARRLAEMDEQTKDLARLRLRDLLGRA